MDLQKLFDSYVESGLYLKGWAPKTVVIYQRAFTSFQSSPAAQTSGVVVSAASIGEVTISKARLEAWVLWMRTSQACGFPHKRNMSPAGANIYIRAMNSFCAWLKEDGHLSEESLVRQLGLTL